MMSVLDVCNNLIHCSVQIAVSINYVGVFESDLHNSFVELLPQCHHVVELVGGEEPGRDLCQKRRGLGLERTSLEIRMTAAE